MSLQAHPELPEFDYLRPASLLEACRFLAEHPGEARPFLGGTDLFVRMRDGAICPHYVVDVKNLDGMSDLRFEPDSGLTIGAAVNMNRVIASPQVAQTFPLLAEACRTVASYQLRTRATIVGNICNASPAGDTIGACIALDGVLDIQGTDGIRQEPLSIFFKGPGKTSLRPGEVVTAIHFPLPPKDSVGKYIKLGRNKLSDLAIVGVTVLGYPDPGASSGFRFRIVLASVAPTPLEALEAERLLSSQAVTPQTLADAAKLAQAACSPIDDVRGGARYRSAMVRNLTYQGLDAVWQKLNH